MEMSQMTKALLVSGVKIAFSAFLGFITKKGDMTPQSQSYQKYYGILAGN